ncbi:MAG: GDSL-type esterase/lipase family protein, partial [bacterium]|nr:GDSL-type esterase/lipase family protein [bacterium]
MATPRRRVLLVGSSIMEQWSATAALLPGAHVVNRAVGGTLTTYWVEHLVIVLVEEQPDAVGIYCGSNDLNQDVSAAGIIANLARCRAIIAQHAAALPCAYFSIIKAPQKLGRWDVIDAINAAVRAQQPAGDLYLELNEVLCPANQPVAPFFID